MRQTLSLVAAPSVRLSWEVGNRPLVTLVYGEAPGVPQPYRVTYGDPQRVSLEAISSTETP